MYRKLMVLVVLLIGCGAPAFAGEKPQMDSSKFAVVINHEEQYSIWAADRPVPKGWKPTGFVGDKEAALDHIEEVWTDMRPLSNPREAALKNHQRLQLKQRNK